MKTAHNNLLSRCLPVLVLAWSLAVSSSALADAPDGESLAGIVLNTGLYANYQRVGVVSEIKRRDWDAGSYLLFNDMPGMPNRWAYSGRIRYSVADRHRLGMETSINPGATASTRLMLGYYGSLSDSWSVKFAIWTTL